MLTAGTMPWIGANGAGMGIFGGGATTSGATANAYIYQYVSNVIHQTTALGYAGNQSAIGNKNNAIFASLTQTANSWKYNWGTAAVTTGVTIQQGIAAVGIASLAATSAKGYYFFDYYDASQTGNGYGYSYATDSITNYASAWGTVFTSIQSFAAAAGNGVFGNVATGGNGIFAFYTVAYSNNAWATSTATWPGGPGGAYLYSAAGNTDVGLFSGYDSSHSVAFMDAYYYATNSVGAGTLLSYSMTMDNAATGNASYGVFAGGSGSLANTSVYTYATAAVASGTNLPVGATNLAAATNTNAGII